MRIIVVGGVAVGFPVPVPGNILCIGTINAGLLINAGVSVNAPIGNFGLMSAVAPGWKLRVLLAQALFSDPEVLLLDEPFGAVDAKIRQELREWLVRLHRELHVTTIFVTRD